MVCCGCVGSLDTLVSVGAGTLQITLANLNAVGWTGLDVSMYGNFDIILDHFPTHSAALCHPTRAV